MSAPWSIALGAARWGGHAFRLCDDGNVELARLDSDGTMRIAPGYLYDGSSGPTVDGAADPVPSLVHDVLYEALRARRLPMSARSEADRIYRELLAERGMGWLRRWVRWAGLRLFGRGAASHRRGPEYPRRTAS